MFLFDVLSLLERMKTEIGPNDAIDDEAAASAYVENFALRVFAMADSEDRKGNATRYVPVLSVSEGIVLHARYVTELLRRNSWRQPTSSKCYPSSQSLRRRRSMHPRKSAMPNGRQQTSQRHSERAASRLQGV